ncbi:MAG: 6-phosphogluconolactonase [Minisyncoccia bacterium]|jgi:6-phosphogluconolactonase/glucosamine-6-phosphate isomerase/deaminase
MQFIQAKDPSGGAAAVADRIARTLRQGKKVLWFVCGGSNIPISVEILAVIRREVSKRSISNLTVAQTDERYDHVGHPESNWQMLIDAGFNQANLSVLPILTGKSVKDTVTDYSRKVEAAMMTSAGEGDLVIGQFGMGEDGHIAGIMPHSPAISDPGPISAYEAGPLVRITVSPAMIERIPVAYAFVFGSPKKEAVRRLREENLSIQDQPAQVLKRLKEAYVYSDQ